MLGFLLGGFLLDLHSLADDRLRCYPEGLEGFCFWFLQAVLCCFLGCTIRGFLPRLPQRVCIVRMGFWNFELLGWQPGCR